MNTTLLTKSLAVAAIVVSSGNLFAENVDTVKVDGVEPTIAAVTDVEEAADAVESAARKVVMLDENGSLNGSVEIEAKTGEDAEASKEATVTLSQDGVVVASVNADQEGNFSFANVEPGTYQLMGASDPYVGQSSFDVVPFNNGGGCASCGLGLSDASAPYAYDTYGSAPASSFGGSCGCGGGGIGGGGGVLGNRRLLRLGLIGGGIAVAIAAGDDDVDDASEDE